MNEQTIKNIITWLMRTDIKGSEAYALYKTVEQLQALLQQQQQTSLDEHLDLDAQKEG